jgi:hypothetical protein
MDAQRYYESTRELTKHAPIQGFSDVIARHALHFEDFLRANRSKNQRQMLTSWVNLTDVNREWLRKICPVLHSENEQFYAVSQKLINNYSNVLGDFVLDGGVNPVRIEDIAKLEGDFYAALVDADKREATRKQWVAYTHSLGAMIYNHDMHGGDSDAYYNSAANCIYAGRLLGAWLDASI